MKTNRLNLTLAVVAAAAFSSIQLRADEAFLSPRARDNQLLTVSGITEDRMERGLLSGSPRGREQYVRVVSGVNTGPNLVTRHGNVIASPRAMEVFPWLTQTPAVHVDGKTLAGSPTRQ